MLTKNFMVAAACAALLFSCSKSDNNDTTPVAPGTDSIPTVIDSTNIEKTRIQGVWTFVQMVSATNTTLTIEDQKMVTTSNYTTINNTGTVTITADSINTVNFGYTVNGWAFTGIYVPNEPVDTVTLPFTQVAQTYSSKSKYKWVSKDSLYGESGITIMGDSTFKAIPAGMKLGWAGDTLLMITKLDTTDKQMVNFGYYADRRRTATTITKLVKK